MAKVSLMKDGSWMVFWEFDVANKSNGSTIFQCTGRKPMFTLTYNYRRTRGPPSCNALSADLKTVETSRLIDFK